VVSICIEPAARFSRWRFPACSTTDAVAALAGGFPARRGLFAGIYGWLLSIGLIWALLHHFLAGLRIWASIWVWGEDRFCWPADRLAQPVRGGRRDRAIALWRLP